MKHKDLMLVCLTLLIIMSFSPLFADTNPNPYSCIIDPEFSNTDLVYAPLATWASSGSNAVLDSLLIINVSSIPDSICIENSTVPIPEAQSGEGFDNSLTFNELIKWIHAHVDSVLVHTQLFIPSGTYNFSDQIVMYSNISLKGAGSNLTELRFLIRADSTSTTMSESDCKKDAILVSGTDAAYKYNCGIENLKILRIREGLDEREVKERVGEYCTNGSQYVSYWGNNIAIRRGTDCWVRGVESSNTFRNHVTLEFAEHVSITGVYFHDANDYGPSGYGYGVGVWNSSSNLVENNIFRHLRHAVTICDRSWYNVIAYNYSLEQYSTALFGLETEWSDIL